VNGPDATSAVEVVGGQAPAASTAAATGAYEVAIVGAGYVGVPLAQVFAEAGRRVVLVDVDDARVARLQRGESYIEDVSSEALGRLITEHGLGATTDYDVVRDVDAIVVALPTPLSANREPDLSIVLSASRELGKRLHTDQLVSLDFFTDFGGSPQVRIDTEPTPDPELVDVVVDVNDEQSGQLSFLVGAGSDALVFDPNALFGKTVVGIFEGNADPKQFIPRMIELWNEETDLSADRFAQHLRTAVERANDRIHLYSKEHPDVRGMGTTVTVAGVLHGSLYLAQVGDSRGYLVRGGVATQLTKDQSLMQRLVDAGELTEEEAELSERRNIILQALGPDPRVKVDLSHQVLRRGDTLLICSDGLSGLVKREEFADMVAAHADLPSLCSSLIDLANERGGPDNITVVAARFDGEGLPEPDGAEDVGYQVYQVPGGDPEDTLAEPVVRPPVALPAVEVVAEPQPVRGRGLLIAIGLLVLAALLLLVLF